MICRGECDWIIYSSLFVDLFNLSRLMVKSLVGGWWIRGITVKMVNVDFTEAIIHVYVYLYYILYCIL